MAALTVLDSLRNVRRRRHWLMVLASTVIFMLPDSSGSRPCRGSRQAVLA
jgi:hypothetical protein